MDTRFLAATLVKLFAVYLGIQVIDSISYTFMTQADYGLHKNRLLLDLVAIAIKAFLAIVFWTFPQIVIRSIMRSENQNSDSTVLIENLMTGACTIFGLFIFVNAAIDGVYWLFFLNNIDGPQAFSFLPPDQKTAIIVTPIEIVIGLLLTFGSRGLMGLIHSARNAGAHR